MEKEKTVMLYSNGYSVRAYNRRIDVEEMDNGDFYISMLRYDIKGANKPAIRHDCLRGRVRVSEFKMSGEGMGDFVYGYLEYIKSKCNLLGNREYK